MIRRYQSPSIEAIWQLEHRYKTWFKVELCYLEEFLLAHGHESAAVKAIETKLNAMDWPRFIEFAAHRELETKHDVIAFLEAAEHFLGEDVRLLHAGLTSSDVLDTAFAINLGEASFVLQQSLKKLIEALMLCAKKSEGKLCLGRTHGQAAEPITLGMKWLSFASEFMRGYERLTHAVLQIKVGKLSGAAGAYSFVSPAMEEKVLTKLGLTAETVSSQIVCRDRHGHFFATLALIGGSLERLAVEIRLLSHGQIQEVSEPFSSKQKGSSAMPHKKNPVLSENITGLMRLLRSYALSAMENQALWHERDISHSSVERVIAPDATNILDFALNRMAGIMTGLNIHDDRVKENLGSVEEKLSSQKVLFALINHQLSRKQAYELVQKASMTSGKSFKEALIDAGVLDYLSPETLQQALIPDHSVPWEETLFRRVLAQYRQLA